MSLTVKPGSSPQGQGRSEGPQAKESSKEMPGHEISAYKGKVTLYERVKHFFQTTSITQFKPGEWIKRSQMVDKIHHSFNDIQKQSMSDPNKNQLTEHIHILRTALEDMKGRLASKSTEAHITKLQSALMTLTAKPILLFPEKLEIAPKEMEKGLKFENAKQFNLAVQHYYEAAIEGNPKGMYDLWRYKGQEGCEKYTAVAEEHLKRAAGTDFCYPPAQREWASILKSQNEFQEASTYYRAAAEQGDPEAMFQYAQMNGKGEGIPKNETNQTEWLRQAALQSHPTAMFELGKILISDPNAATKKEGFDWLLKGAEKGNVHAMNLVIRCYEGSSGVKMNVKEADAWTEKAKEALPKAAAQGDVEAMFLLAEKFRYGDREGINLGEEINLPAAEELYEKAALKGHIESMAKIGLILTTAPYYKNNFAINARGFDFLTQAANKGNSNAMLDLSTCYRSGIGVRKNDKLADEWYEKYSKAPTEL